MNNQDVINYLLLMSNTDCVTNVMLILNGFIDEKPLPDRIVIKAGLASQGVEIADPICHRDDE